MEAVSRYGLDFDRLLRLTVVEGVAVNTAPLRVGDAMPLRIESGREEVTSLIDMPVLRGADGRPYIPGSSIKGALRSLAEAIARASGARVCNVFDPESPCVEALRKLKEGKPAEVGEGPCVVCRLFGNQELASHVVVHDAMPEGGSVSVLQRTRVGIDRFRSAARAGILFTYEYVPRNYRWRVRLDVYNVDVRGSSEEAKLLRSLLKCFSEGLPVGGMRSVGHGLLRLDPEGTKVRVFVVRDFALTLAEELKLSELVGWRA